METEGRSQIVKLFHKQKEFIFWSLRNYTYSSNSLTTRDSLTRYTIAMLLYIPVTPWKYIKNIYSVNIQSTICIFKVNFWWILFHIFCVTDTALHSLFSESFFYSRNQFYVRFINFCQAITFLMPITVTNSWSHKCLTLCWLGFSRPIVY